MGRLSRRHLAATDSHCTAGCARTQTREQGFTLLELLAAITIVATISAIAIPLYTQYTERTHRTILISDLLTCAQALERFAALNFTFENAADTDGDGEGDADNGPIAGDICNPESTQAERYDITVVADRASYVLTGTPDADGPMRDDGFLRLDERGNRAWDKNNDGNIGAEEDNWYEG